VISRFHPLRHFGAISEKIDDQLKSYIEKESLAKKIEAQGALAPRMRTQPVQGKAFKSTYYLKYMRSVVHPGENVGTIAGQSVGEPSTQMTLNTFHLAGHGAENMTLGIPRLKEILMTTPTNIKTPNMTVYFRKEAIAKMSRSDMEKFANRFKKIRLSDVTKEVKVSQFIQAEGENFHRIYKITLEFEPFDKIRASLGLTFEEVLKVFSDKFLTLLLTEISKQVKKSGGGQAPEATEGTNKTRSRKTESEKRASEVDMIEEEERAITQSKKAKKKDDDEESEDFNTDIDGVQKRAKDLRSYEQTDEIAEEPAEDEDEDARERRSAS
jgi:DNA-directed RNA polymerase I subunit RPA1